MKDLFPEYYSYSVEEFNELWQKCIFIFDTNVLLDFYEYRKATREDFFKVLEAIKNRLWIPHQVALEYQKNTLKKILQVQSNFEKVESKFTNTQNELNKSIQIISEDADFKKCISPEFFQEVKEEIKKAFETIFNELIQYKEESIKTNELDCITDKIADLLEGKIGNLPVNQKELDDIYEDGEIRYKMFRPPGFSDEEKKKDKDNHYIHRNLVFQRAYGDLIIWKQILKEVKLKQHTHIIFITGDRKEDWWRKKDKKIIGLLPELVEEILEAGASMFYMYTPDNFLKYAHDHLKLEIEKKSIEQVEEISVSNSLSELEQSGNSSRQSLLIDNCGLSNIEDLAMAANLQAIAKAQNIQNVVSAASNLQAIVKAANNQAINSNIPDFAKQLAAINSMQLTNIYDREQEINSEYLPDSNASQEVDP